ncbi:MAG: hypothetical protein M1358_10640 [Chloroflexi bacterium]|nr:hypothetical protein [Chloroflexota bacterium]
MMKVAINFPGVRSGEIEVPSESHVAEVVQAAVALLGLPSSSSGLYRYQVTHVESWKILRDEETLASAGVKAGDTLTFELLLQPQAVSTPAQVSVMSVTGSPLWNRLSTSTPTAKRDRPESSAISTTGKERHSRGIGGGSPARELTARVNVPSDEELEVNLVPSTSVYRLGEHRGDQMFWREVSFLFFGSLLGIAVNLSTSWPTVITTPLIIIGLLLLAFALIALVAAKRYEHRAEDLIASVPSLDQVYRGRPRGGTRLNRQSRITERSHVQLASGNEKAVDGQQPGTAEG